MKFRVYRMAVRDTYPTPWCGWATWKDGSLERGINCEARTQNEAEQKIKEMTNEIHGENDEIPTD